ncbi:MULTISPECIES: hypothetical protein [Clostridia]|uniref:hypothetical protein n=1 Tax=Clostridia TaxID=186801 RepID=UPI001314DBF2|nr:MULTISPECIES: hypothetical protein [Clostridia]
MEYTRSFGEYYETYEGKPRDIAKLIKVLDKESCANHLIHRKGVNNRCLEN